MSDQYVPPNPSNPQPRTVPHRDPLRNDPPNGPVQRDSGPVMGTGTMLGAVVLVAAVLAAVFYASSDSDTVPSGVVTDPVAVPQTDGNATTGGTTMETAPADPAVPTASGVVTPDTAAPDATVPDAVAPDAATGDAPGAAVPPPAATTQP